MLLAAFPVGGGPYTYRPINVCRRTTSHSTRQLRAGPTRPRCRPRSRPKAEPAWPGAADLGVGRAGVSGGEVVGAVGPNARARGIQSPARRCRHSHRLYRRGRRGAADHRDPGRVRRAAGDVAAGRARTIPARPPGVCGQACSASSLRHCVGRRGNCRGRTVKERPSAGHRALLRLSGRRGQENGQESSWSATPTP